MQVVLLQEGSDLDALSSAYGITLLNKKAKIALPNSLSSSVIEALNLFKDIFKEKTVKKDELDFSKVEVLYITDSQDFPKDFTGKIIIYDHHIKNLTFPENVEHNIEPIGSTTTLVVEEIKKRKKKLSSEDATILALGIYEDTGSLKFKGTTVRDIKALEYLFKFKVDLNTVRKIIEDKFNIQDLSVMEEITKNTEIVEFRNLKVAISYYKGRYSKDISKILKYIKILENTDAYFVVVGQKGKLYIIGRSKSDSIDVAKILSVFEGGGHSYAAAAKVKGFSVEEIVNFIKFILIERKLTVKEMIETGVPTVKIGETVGYISNLPHFPMYVVVDNVGRFEGVINYKVVKDLLKHGFESEKIDNFIVDCVVLSADSYLFDIVKLFKSTDQEIFPVVEKGKFIGIVSRKSILKTLFKEDSKIVWNVKPKERSYLLTLQKSLPQSVITHFREIGQLSQKLGFRAFLVGGFVRDIVMGRKNLDIDILIEGDATVVVREYGKLKNVSYFYYPEFLTGYIKTEEGLKIDFASARKEVYDYPGAYPRVEIASVKEDLIRRDFTINTLLIEITGENFGKIIDYFGGLRDIKEKRVRVLHPVSFIEDPIRILRALRFAGRFNFKLEGKTEKLLITAVSRDILEFAPPGRVKLEFELTFNEKNVFDILKLMDQYKVLSYVFRIDNLSEFLIRKLQKTQDSINLFKELFNKDLDKTFLYSVVLISDKPLEIGYKILKSYHFEREAKNLEKIYRYIETIRLDKQNIQNYVDLSKQQPEIVALTVILSDDDISSHIINVIKKIEKPIISGKDLIDLGLKPSPLFKEILNKINNLYLQGEFKTKEDCIKYIKENYINKVRE
ncbi:MAG: DHHA1 domain-containing protein [Hydrogenothermaceae bacterium]